MAEKMTLEQVRDLLRHEHDTNDGKILWTPFGDMADAITAHLAQPAQAVSGSPVFTGLHQDGTPRYEYPPQPAQAVDVRAEAYAERLARALWRKHYADDAPQWEPLTGDLLGMLSQIDNMTTGLTRAIGNAQAEGWSVSSEFIEDIQRAERLAVKSKKLNRERMMGLAVLKHLGHLLPTPPTQATPNAHE